MHTFSAFKRNDNLKKAKDDIFDIIIIGGGITGAGIALDASWKGLKVLLLEKNDFASGTSSKSTKLIHGGLRYLKQLQFGVVRKTGLERALLYKNARHLVRPEPMMLPVIEGGSLGKLTTRLALFVYETLAGVPLDERFKMLSAKETIKSEPGIKKSGLLGSAVYTEYRTDDARLTISVLKSAVKLGAICMNYAEVKSLNHDSGKVNGVLVRDLIDGGEYLFKSKIVVNATGPWVDSIRRMEIQSLDKHIVLSKGVHVVVDFSALPIMQSVYFDTPDGRMIFAIPRNGKTYIGTTDTLFESKPDDAGINQEDIDYLIKSCNIMFPDYQLKLSDIESSWTGLRPLIAEAGKSTSELSRKDEIFESDSGLISIAGGKLTGYRVMAEDLVNRITKKMGGRVDSMTKSTKNFKLSGGDFSSEKDIAEFIEKEIGEAKQIGASPRMIISWVERYGRETESIVEKAFEIWAKEEDKSRVPLLAELTYCMEEEMVCHPLDFWNRRTGKLYFEFNSIAKEFEEYYPYMVEQLNYSDSLAKQFKYEFYAAMDSVKP